MTDKETIDRTVAEVRKAFAHRPGPGNAIGPAEAFAFDLGAELVAAIESEGFPPSVQLLLCKLDGSHPRPPDLERLTRRELIAVRKCLHLLSYRDEIGDGPVRIAMRKVVQVRPLTH